MPLINMVMDEFKHVVKGVHLPANRVAKLIDANRFHDVLYKIVRGLHFHPYGGNSRSILEHHLHGHGTERTTT